MTDFHANKITTFIEIMADIKVNNKKIERPCCKFCIYSEDINDSDDSYLCRFMPEHILVEEDSWCGQYIGDAIYKNMDIDGKCAVDIKNSPVIPKKNQPFSDYFEYLFVKAIRGDIVCCGLAFGIPTFKANFKREATKAFFGIKRISESPVDQTMNRWMKDIELHHIKNHQLA